MQINPFFVYDNSCEETCSTNLKNLKNEMVYIHNEKVVIMRPLHIVQPYRVGSKNSNSLAVRIPSAIRKKNHIDPSTVFLVRSENSEIILQRMDIDKKMIPVDQSFEAIDQQVSIVKGND